jgi:hypothetical protein
MTICCAHAETSTPPSVNLTVPAPGPLPGVGEIAALYVTRWPTRIGFVDAETVVVVATKTSSVMGVVDAEWIRVVLPEYLALMVWLPSVGYLTVHLACPDVIGC